MGTVDAEKTEETAAWNLLMYGCVEAGQGRVGWRSSVGKA